MMQSLRLVFRMLFVCFFSFTVLSTYTEVTWADSHQLVESFDINTIELLDLDTAITIALTGNPTIAAAADRVRQAKARSRSGPLNLLAPLGCHRVRLTVVSVGSHIR